MEPLEGLREHVGGGVAQHREVLVGLIRDDLDPCAVVDRRVLFDEFAVDLPRDRVATEPGADPKATSSTVAPAGTSSSAPSGRTTVTSACASVSLIPLRNRTGA